MSHGPWRTREDEAGDFSRWGFWLFFQSCILLPPLFHKAAQGPRPSFPLPAATGVGVVLSGAG